MNHKWLLSVIKQGWMRYIPAFKVKDNCKRCKEKFTHIWLDGLNKKTYLMCMVCRDEWVHYNRRRIKKEHHND